MWWQHKGWQPDERLEAARDRRAERAHRAAILARQLHEVASTTAHTRLTRVERLGEAMQRAGGPR